MVAQVADCHGFHTPIVSPVRHSLSRSGSLNLNPNGDGHQQSTRTTRPISHNHQFTRCRLPDTAGINRFAVQHPLEHVLQRRYAHCSAVGQEHRQVLLVGADRGGAASLVQRPPVQELPPPPERGGPSLDRGGWTPTRMLRIIAISRSAADVIAIRAKPR